MRNIFSDILSFTITLKPEIERSIHSFASGGGITGDVHVLIDTFYDHIKYEPPIGDHKNIPLGTTILTLKFPEWLANEEYHSNYKSFTKLFKELGMQLDGSFFREIKNHVDIDRASLIRESINMLDTTFGIAKEHFVKSIKE